MNKENKTKKANTTSEETEAVEVEETTSSEVEVQLDAKGIPIWKTDENELIGGLKRPHFIENVKAEDKKLALNSFYLYMVECKKEKLAYLHKYCENLETAIESYKQKAEDVLHEPTEKEKKARRLEAIQKEAERIRKELEEMED